MTRISAVPESLVAGLRGWPAFPKVIFHQLAQRLEMLGGISRTTFYRLRKKWENAGTPFPSPVTEIGTPKGGALYRYEEVMGFFRKMKLL